MINQFTGKNRFLSNFWVFDNTSVEHQFQAAKAVSVLDKQMIMNAATPGNAKRLGKIVPVRSDWEEIKLVVMRMLVLKKFENKHLRKLLLQTGEEELAEGNNWGDVYWGVDIQTGIGENHLGKILMEVREEYKALEEFNKLARVVTT
jgi:ribA/ribD-fused uncharacterized protein